MKQEKLPPDIEPLVYRQALPLDSGLDFHQHTERLISGICESLDIALPSAKRLQLNLWCAISRNAVRLLAIGERRSAIGTF